ncbi:ABC transporter substrate-binding protein [Microlunatus ginsengisoli]|uniref:ABC transporter substrate-binding protein n=1 Tax=Microlunatus ginsengisoli TaxID=363863 RepID=A0ABP6ZRH1_9ACTN
MSITSRPVSRRMLLQGLAGAGLAGTLFGAAGCASAVHEARGQQAARTGGPQRGGTINAGISEDLIPGNFFTNSTAGITTVIGLAYESLVRYPSDTVKPTPRLATEWELGNDGRSLELRLRDDVSFHSGRPFTSADAAFSIKTYGDPLWTAQLKSTANAITFFDTSDPHRLVLTFDHPLGNIFDLLDTVPIVDSQTIDQLRTGEKLIGTGPFRVANWTPNAKISFERNENYWIPDRPYADAVETKIITDAKALLSALKSGQVDFADGLSYLDTENLVKAGGFSDIRLEGAETQLYVGANVTAKPLDDVRLRQAIAYALDRDRVVHEVLRGVGYPVNLPWPTYSPAFDRAANTHYQRNVEKAKALVAEVGTVPTIPYTYSSPNPLVEATAAIVQANLAEVGIPVQLDPVDGAQFVKQLIGAKFRGLWTTFHSWAQYTPSTLTVSAYPFNAHHNASQFVSKDYIAHADAAWQIADGTSREAVAAYAKVSEDLLDNVFLAEIAVVLPQWARSNKLQGVSYTKRSELQLTDAWVAQE